MWTRKLGMNTTSFGMTFTLRDPSGYLGNVGQAILRAADFQAGQCRTWKGPPQSGLAAPQVYCTAIVTVFDITPPIDITTGTALPLAEAAGTLAFTWYSPTNPGARPENSTVAFAPPIMTIGSVVVDASGPPGA